MCLPALFYLLADMLFAFVCLCLCFKNVNKLDSSTRVHQITWGKSVTGMEIGLGKRWRRFRAFVVFGVLVWTLADMQMNHGSSNAHAQWFSHGRSEQTIMMS